MEAQAVYSVCLHGWWLSL